VVVTQAAVERPRSAEELAATLRQAARDHLAVVPVGGGRASRMGNPLERCDVMLHTSRLDRVIEHSQADMVVTVEAGITLEDLQAELAKAGQFLPLDPFNSPGHTIGGLLATGWTGPLRFRYGSPRDFLIGIRVALPDGHLASAGGRVVKNVSGYDLMKLHYGALGSLGVIVAASFKVFPRPLHDVTVAGPGELCWELVDRALDLPLPPAAIEILPDGRVVARFFGSPEAVKSSVHALGWKEADSSVWTQHSRAAAGKWARIAVPRRDLRQVLQSLPPGAQSWWASPAVGVAHWEARVEAYELREVRRRAEMLGGTLDMLAAPDDFMRAAGAWGTPPKTLEVMRRLKDAFDPDHILNPGRFVV
jgi:glycolate oxidase FAD binding subunit